MSARNPDQKVYVYAVFSSPIFVSRQSPAFSREELGPYRFRRFYANQSSDLN